MKRSSVVLALCIGVFLLFSAVSLLDPTGPLNFNRNPDTLTILISISIVLTIAAFVLEFENRALKAREISLASMLGAVSAVSRIPFGPIPSLQPCTFLVICSGYAFGSVTGFMVGMLTAIISNFFFGHGPWTIYQMFAWGLVGASSGLLGRVKMPRKLLIPFGLAWGYCFGFIMNLWFLTAFGFPVNIKSLVSLQLLSLWPDTLHGVGNAIFIALFGSRIIRILERFKSRQLLVFTNQDKNKPQ
ncbi:MAG: ECF transporter S component [Candidatus Altiarchaeota archaeon]|nr:ECF transporter S component [Candidatus Altiarchaeota archaeon]